MPLDGLFADEKYGLGGSELLFDSAAVHEIIPKFLEECLVNGYHYAIPYMRSTEACYVNKTFVEKLGYTLPETLTWDFVWEVSQAATEKNPDGTYKVNGQNVLIPFVYKSTDNMMISMLKQKGTGAAIELAIRLLLNSQQIEVSSDFKFYDLIEETKELCVNIPYQLTDTVLLEDIFDYILPAGVTYHFARISNFDNTVINAFVATASVDVKKRIEVAESIIDELKDIMTNIDLKNLNL